LQSVSAKIQSLRRAKSEGDALSIVDAEPVSPGHGPVNKLSRRFKITQSFPLIER
jgi:hypothetical protein